MKKLLLMIMLLFTLTITNVMAETVVVAYDYDVIDGFGYNLETGKAESNPILSSTTKMILSKANSGYALNFLNTEFHHVLFYNDSNQYIGYINGDNSSYEGAYYLGYDVTAITNYPSNAHSFNLVNYNYEIIRDGVAVTNPTIDNIAWEELTYRDIFGDSLYSTGSNNLIDNGDFTSPNVYWETFTDGITFTDYVDLITTDNDSQFIYSGGELDTNHIYYLQVELLTLDYGQVYSNSFLVPDTFTTIGFNSQLGAVKTTYLIFGRRTIDTHVTFDNMSAFDLTNIFDPYDLGNTLPTIAEFETMLDFYKLYVDAPEELTYNDIFYNTNLVLNGDFNSTTDNWTIFSATSNVSNGILELNGTGASTIFYMYQTVPTFELDDVYYVSTDLKTDIALLSTRFKINGGTQILWTPVTLLNEWNYLSGIFTASVSGANFEPYYYFNSILEQDTVNLEIDNISSYNLTDIFAPDLEPDITTFESYYDVWTDPLGEYYPVYYTASQLEFINITYEYEAGEEIVLDADSGLDTFLTNINMNSTEGKAGLGIFIMIGLAILMGFFTKSKPITIITIVVAFLGFTVIGWFPVWIVILIAVGLTLLALFKATN